MSNNRFHTTVICKQCEPTFDCCVQLQHKGQVWPHLSWAIEHLVIWSNLNVLCQSLKATCIWIENVVSGYFQMVLLIKVYQEITAYIFVEVGPLPSSLSPEGLLCLLLVITRIRLSNTDKASYLHRCFHIRDCIWGSQQFPETLTSEKSQALESWSSVPWQSRCWRTKNTGLRALPCLTCWALFLCEILFRRGLWKL